MSKSERLINEFMHDVPRGVTSRYLNQQAVPQARWQSPEDIYNSGGLEYSPENPGKKILVGAIGDKLVGIEDNRHILTVAGSRSGKSVSIIGNLLFYRGSVLATDPKGELANITALRRAEMGQKVCVLDPFNTVSDSIAHLRKSYNPLSILTIGSPTIIEDAGLIADALVIAKGKDPHWDESAKQFIEGIILHVVTSPKHENDSNLVTVRKLIMNALRETVEEQEDQTPNPYNYKAQEEESESAFKLQEAMLKNAERLNANEVSKDLAEIIAGSANDFYERGTNERSSVLSTVRRHTKFLDYTAMRNVLKDSDFDLSELKSNPSGLTIYLCLPASRMSICNRWFRLFINQLLVAMEQEKTVPPAPVLVCLDEFPVLVYTPPQTRRYLPLNKIIK